MCFIQEKKACLWFADFSTRYFFFNFWFSPPLILIQGMLNFKNSSGSCLDYITGMLLQKEYICITLFITDSWIFFPVISHSGCISPAPPPSSPSAQTTERPLTVRLLWDKTSPDSQAWQLTHKAHLLIHRSMCVVCVCVLS